MSVTALYTAAEKQSSARPQTAPPVLPPADLLYAQTDTLVTILRSPIGGRVTKFQRKVHYSYASDS